VYYAMTGWRVGYMALDKSLYDPVKRLHFYNLACVNTFVQSAALAALEGDQKYSEDMRKEYEKRRDYLVNAINEIPGLCCSMPSGAFYIFMNISDSGMSADAFCQFMLDNAGVAMVPGSVFGEHGSRFVRLSYATSMENLQKSVSRISKVYQTLRERREENHG
ncbi:aminotransferase class I/II-fold pyridoxal phosphate-dependent enzyme, partial [Anaerotignum sp.]|uniref:aminotransferase class I/II-fold pyridoxal phosphate-dependent enzyme n=1 Tax=Anaerotignum sp. TaxID=2039241 RepID=UPI0037359CA9